MLGRADIKTAQHPGYGTVICNFISYEGDGQTERRARQRHGWKEGGLSDWKHLISAIEQWDVTGRFIILLLLLYICRGLQLNDCLKTQKDFI